MSKSSLKKFRKNDWNDEEENFDNRSHYLEKKRHKRVERALKTKDISLLTDEFDDFEDDYYESR